MAALIAHALATAEATVFVLPAEASAPLEASARQRCDRDPADWPAVAPALTIHGAIWTEDHGFFDCGVATWRGAVLAAILG